VQRNVNTDTPLPPEIPHGQNPPDGAIIDYTLPHPATTVAITIRDARGTVVRRYTSSDPSPEPVEFDKPAYWERPFTRPPADAGMHRFVWDLHESTPPSVAIDLPISANDEDTPRVPQGALVAPGRYTVDLTVDGLTTSRPLTLVMDPRIAISQRALDEQYAMAHETAGLMASTYAAFAKANAAHGKEAAAFARLNGELTLLIGLVDGADAPVPEGTRRAFCTLQEQALHLLGQPHPRNPLCSF
jgi:hypothetical protein